MLYYVLIQRSPKSKIKKTKKIKKIKKRSSKRKGNKMIPWLLAIMLLMPEKKRKRIGIMISVKLYIIIAIRKAILQIPSTS